MTPRLFLATEPSVENGAGDRLMLAERDAVLLAWLAVEGPTSRDRLCQLLWPSSSPEQARTTLRQRLFRLKKALGIDLAIGSPTLRLVGGLQHDLTDAPTLLGDLVLGDAPELDAWLAGRREELRNRELDDLREQAQALEDAGDHRAALCVAQALRRLEPHSELAHQRLIRLHYLAGDRAAALEAFDELEQVLKHEIGAAPSPQTLALLETVERAESAPAATRRELPVAVLRPPRMVGRESELAALAQAWNGARVATVVGEAGMGKSRMLAEFSATYDGIVVAQARPGDAGVPFASLARVLREIGRRHAPPPLPDDERLQLARVLPELAAAGTVFQEGQRLRLQLALGRYIASAPGLRGLVLDDLHFADAASLEMLPGLLAESRAPRWALAFRPAEAGSALRTLQDTLAEAAQLQPVALAPLSEAGVAALVDDLQLGLDGRAIAPALHRRTGGNPLFALETLKQAWVEGSVATLCGDAVQLPRAQTVGRLIDRRIAQLSPPALALARVASIAGLDFDLDLAETVLGTPALLLADALHELEAAQVLRGTQFAHDLVADSVLRSVPQALAEHVHGKVAAWLEAHEGEPARVAAHWLAARRPERAREWLQRAFKAAEQAFRWQEALGFLVQKAEIDEALGDLDAAFETRQEAVVYTGHVCELQQVLDQCDRLASLARGDRQLTRALLSRAHQLAIAGRYAEAEQAARAAREQAQRQRDPELVHSCELELLPSLVMLRRDDEALALSEACRKWIDAHPIQSDRPAFYNVCSVLFSNLFRYSEAQRDGERALSLCVDGSHEAVRLTVMGNLAVSLHNMGRYDAAASQWRQALALSNRFDGALLGSSIKRMNLAGSLCHLGEFDAALQLAEQAVQELRVRAPPTRAHPGATLGLAWLRLGQFARARQAVLDTLAIPSAPHGALARAWLVAHDLQQVAGFDWDGRSPLSEVERLVSEVPLRMAQFNLQLVQARKQPVLEALVSLEDLVERARSFEMMGTVLDCHVLAARVASSSDPAQAMGHVEAAMALFDTAGCSYAYRGEYWLNLGHALRAAGQHERALHLVAEGAEWVRRTARQHVPEPFRDSFLHRNPVNVELLALAAELGRGAA